MEAFPDVVNLLRHYLIQHVPGVDVWTRVPRNPPDRMVQIRRVGGVATPPVRDHPRVDIFAWARDEHTAMQLGLQVRAAMWALPGSDLNGTQVYSVSEFMGLRQIDDPATGSPQVWATYQLMVRADAAIHPAHRPI